MCSSRLNHFGGQSVTRGKWDTYEGTRNAASRRAPGTTQERQRVSVGGRGSRILTTEGLRFRYEGGVILDCRKRKVGEGENGVISRARGSESHAMAHTTAATLTINTPNINAAQGQHSVFCPESVCSRSLPVRTLSRVTGLST